ncbi:MAG: hypothetical protein NVS2B3_02550 [Vulcanimicrobiaceae bacterium]
MIAALIFDTPALVDDGRVVRRASYVPRSTLPITAACLVANGARETLARLLATELEVDLIEPTIPLAAERRTLLENAAIVRVRGRLCDGFVVLRPLDQRRLVALAFDEHERSESDALSEIERATVDRVIAALVPLCNTLCGTLGPVRSESAERAACDLVTYFEVRTTGAVRLAIGFALAADPAEAVTDTVTLEDLADVELEATIEVAAGYVGVPAFSRLTNGATLALDTGLDMPGMLRFGDVDFARGTCGVSGGRRALRLDVEPVTCAAR